MVWVSSVYGMDYEFIPLISGVRIIPTIQSSLSFPRFLLIVCDFLSYLNSVHLLLKGDIM